MQRIPKLFSLASALAVLLCFTQCAQFSTSIPAVVKIAKQDPFKESIVESQYFEIDPTEENVVEGANGTLIVIPEGAYLDKNGKPVEDPVTVELAEALTLDEMLLSNLTTTSDGKLLETGGMIYLNATSQGKQVNIDPANPLYIEIPTPEKKPGMMAYDGLRDAEGNMNWVDPRPLVNYLTPVGLEELDFLPKGFMKGVEEGMPFRGHTTASAHLVDSLYYSFALSDGSRIVKGFTNTNTNEPLLQDDYPSWMPELERALEADSLTTYVYDGAAVFGCDGINPAMIKLIKGKQFENTFIATREFEVRMKALHRSAMDRLLELYIENLDKNLWEVDSLVWTVAPGKMKLTFENFYRQKLTKVEGGDRRAEQIRKHYRKQLSKLTAELQRARSKMMDALERENEKSEKLVSEYRNVLKKREAYRMERYGFVATENGWKNIDVPSRVITEVDCKLEATVLSDEAEKFDFVCSYLVFTDIRSLTRLNTRDQKVFYTAQFSNRQMIMPINQKAMVISVAYKGDEVYLASGEVSCCVDSTVELTLQRSSKREMKSLLKSFDKYSKENSLEVEIKYQKELAKEWKRQQNLMEEHQFLVRLYSLAFPICDNLDSVDELIPYEDDHSMFN